jgi:hypothetical protein
MSRAERVSSDDASAPADSTQPLISVPLPVTLAWPAAEASVASVLAQENAPPFEVLVLDGNREAPTHRVTDPRVRWFHLPDSNTFELRAAGIAAARGTIVAITEDHCVATNDWLAQIATAHDRDRCIALLGATRNHADAAVSAMDRANFVVTFAGQNTKRLDLDVRNLPAPTNLSFKIAALPSRDVTPADLEYRWLQALRKLGELHVSPAVVLQHNQCLGATAPLVHFASGRSFGASVRNAPWKHQLRWWAALPSLPVRLLSMTLPDLLRGAGGTRPSLADFACLALLLGANVGGQIIGALTGAGASRRRL